jgi:alkyl hydroperoxide reductase subunit AhpC/Tfp pilus assembly protein PilN
MTLRINDVAPDFTAETTEGTIDFHDWIGDGWAVLFSHPKDFTPVCTTELGAVASLKPEFDKRNCKVLGISVDAVSDHERWSKDIEASQGTALNYPLVGDPTLAVVKQYDMLPADEGDTAEGRTPMDNATARSVFIIGPDKKIKATLTYPMSTGRNFAEILRLLDSVQLTAAEQVATPANWEQGDDVIILPAVSEAAALHPHRAAARRRGLTRRRQADSGPRPRGRLRRLGGGRRTRRWSSRCASTREASMRTRSLAPFLLLLLLALFGGASPAPGQAPDDPLVGIDRSLREIASLMRLQLSNQRAELAVRRLDIARRELAARERELHAAESNRDGYQSQLESLRVQIDQFDDVPPEQIEEMERWRAQTELDLANLKQSTWRADQRILDLSRDIQRAREDLEIWEEIVAKAFEED